MLKKMMYASILSIVLGGTIWLGYHRSTPSTHVVDTILPYCSSGILRNVVSGSSMAPLLSDGQEIVIQTDKNCYTLSRGDIIVYDYAQDVSNANPVVKRVIAGDTTKDYHNKSTSGGILILDGALACWIGDGYNPIVSTTMKTDFDNFWKIAKVGDVTSFAGGKIAVE